MQFLDITAMTHLKYLYEMNYTFYPKGKIAVFPSYPLSQLENLFCTTAYLGAVVVGSLAVTLKVLPICSNIGAACPAFWLS